VEWSLNLMTNGAMRLREMERSAKQAKRGIWVNYVPQNTGQTKLSDTFLGKVVEVVSGDTVVVKDINGGGMERRVSLSRYVWAALYRGCRAKHSCGFVIAHTADGKSSRIILAVPTHSRRGVAIGPSLLLTLHVLC
jgi:endonuclease YncB( thermonuclease family)